MIYYRDIILWKSLKILMIASTNKGHEQILTIKLNKLLTIFSYFDISWRIRSFYYFIFGYYKTITNHSVYPKYRIGFSSDYTL